MTLRYTKTALRQLDPILAYIDQRSPQGAVRVHDRIRAVEELLQRHPESGEETSRPGMRRVVANPYPYSVLYRVQQGQVVVHGVRHTSRRPR